ncbi:Superfamily II DNA and RNA helicase [Paracoccus saliphilus]|uniref:DEAD-box ATP-dependent RNA helicase RhpA n=1 Tax=Paracoccus saliphilus TaxID=405559 RepID=A0AA45W1X8_9RHOB|nr:DEAD/DEAH box helicase [Paracoccus saliphilus]WCR01762.1 DEAD/DEAH box helicase [Paracoccus saliphilus]SIS62995.1 Superfamily II DNA and RNA helicase [Paracoccus saliphilus]
MTKFSDLKLDPKVLKAITEAGYENPTPIQAGAIPPALEGRDVLGIAQTGTGKTASFTLPMITMLGRGRARARMPRSLVLCPTRELAAQVAENFDIYAKHTRLTKALLIGGVSFGEQDKLIDRGVDVLIATPGRLLDHFERGKLLLTGVQIMVVDEADRMLDMGFIPDIERIFQLTPFTRQTLFFSATMAPEIERITNTFLHAPERIEVARQATASETITQRLVEIAPARRDQAVKQKRELLRALIDAEGEALTNAIIFCNRKTDVDIVAKSLKKYGYDAAPIHGDLDQSHRTRTLDGFRDGSLKLLVASDVAARGLDIPAVSHVINFDLPSHAEDYIHRIGRTGRAGRKGTAISIGTSADDKYLSAIETLVKQSLPRVSLPEGFSPSEESRSAPREDRKDSRGSTRRRGSRRDDERSQDRDRPQDRDRQQDKPDTRSSGDRRTPAEAEAPKPERGNQRRDDRRRGRGEDRGPAVVGMGNHVPEFMLVSLRSATDSAAVDRDDAPEAADQQVAEKPAEAPAKPKRTRRKSSKSTDQAKTEQKAEDAPVPQETATGETASKEATVEDQAAQDAVESAPAKPKRTRRKKSEATETADAPEAAKASETAPAAEEPKPRKTRSRSSSKAKTEEKPAETGEEAPKPKRSTRRKKADDAPEAEADSKAETAAPKLKTTRSRRKKTDEPATDSGSDPQPVPSETADSSDS